MPSRPSTPVDMVIDYYKYDYEFAEPPRVTILQNTMPLLTFKNFGDDVYPGSNVLLVTVTDDESRRIEQQPDNQTKAEAVEVLRKMFPGKDVPDATDILVPRWWSNRFFKCTFSNWPIGISRYEYDLIRAPVGRVYFKGEHTSDTTMATSMEHTLQVLIRQIY
ncbi:unnamed protein product [Urochloa humidicola]